MTVYLWHLTALLFAVGAAIALGGIGLSHPEGSSAWWSLRPVWVLVLTIMLLGLIAVFGRVETWSRARTARTPGPAMSVCGALIACSGLTVMALQGLSLGSGLLLGFLPPALCLVGTLMCSFSIAPR